MSVVGFLNDIQAIATFNDEHLPDEPAYELCHFMSPDPIQQIVLKGSVKKKDLIKFLAEHHRGLYVTCSYF